MTGSEIMRAFRGWWGTGANRHAEPPFYPSECYPLYIGHPLKGRWYVRERMPGSRVWRAEDDGSFTLLEHPNTISISDPRLREACER